MNLVILAFAVATLTSAAFASEKSPGWSRFRGPNGSGVAEDQKPPVDFGPDKNVRWKTPAPSGLSSPIVAGENVIITGFEGNKLYTIAYSRAGGKEAWRAEAPAAKIEPFHKAEGSPAASTSASDGQRIVSYFGSCGLFCYDLNGKQLWKYELPPASTGGDFGSGVSPIIVDNTVVLVRDEMKDAKIVALDATSGALKWETKRLSPSSYSTPIVWETPSGKEIVAPGHARIFAYDLKTGTEKWFVSGIPSASCSSAVATADKVLFAGGASGPEGQEMQIPPFDSMLKDLDKDKDGSISKEEGDQAFQGFFDNQDQNKDGKITREEWDTITKFFSEGKNSAFAVKPGGKGDVTDTHVLWKKAKGLPYIASALVYGTQYIMVKDGGIVTAYHVATGDELFQERLAAPGSYYASPVVANDHIYLFNLEGVATVLKLTGDKPEVVLDKLKLGERTAATPAISDNALFVRTDKHLYAFGAAK